jgi:argininosuccinate lyase
MAKIWHKDYEPDKLLENFTTGEDYILDMELVIPDCTASIAQAVMLGSIGIISKKEMESLKKGLKEIIELKTAGKFKIKKSDEDCHTAIENFLIKKCGDAGRKIHTGRSRNDQVLTALRLYSKGFLLKFIKSLLTLILNLIDFADRNKKVPMPGRTHMQIAMPSSVGLWAASFAEELIDVLELVKTVYEINNMCPLGSAASYGVPLPLNREMTAELLGFKKVQNNVLYANNSRGKIESMILDSAEQAVLTLSKLSQELILFSMPEFSYFKLPDELCTGSSIMPQKKNPDGLELIRAKTATVSSCSFQIKRIISSLPAGYNRDFQETKEPFMRGIKTALGCINIMNLTIEKLKVNKEKLKVGFTPEIYATDAALELVQEGTPFREAYKAVGLNLDELNIRDPEKIILARKSSGSTGNLKLNISRKRLSGFSSFIEKEEGVFKEALKTLTGRKINLFSL